ncbi:MAG TPA: hypothetical protein VIJ36_14595 [Thermoanaerobaculia bacterium]
MEPPRVEPAPPPASPFNPQARPKAGGCPKPLIFGCLGLLVLVGLGFLGFFFYVGTHVGQLLQFSLRQSETAITQQLPPQVTPADRQRLHQAFEAAQQRAGHAARAQDIAESSQQLQLEMLHVIRKGQDHKLTRADVQALSQTLEEFARTGTAPDARP